MRTLTNVPLLVRSAMTALVILIAAGVVLLGPASFGTSTTEAAGFTVDSTADASDANPGNGICATAGGACTLRAAIEEANALPGSDVISVPAGTYILSLGQLSLSSGLTLNGAGDTTTIVDGAALDRVFSTSGTVVISDLTIRNGSTAASGGGINNGGSLTLNDAIVSDNFSAADYSASGIYNGSTLTLNNSTVSGNVAGGQYSTGGIKNPSSRTLTLNDSTVSGNSAPGDYGTGGIKNFQSANATLNNSTVSGNSAGGNYGTGGIENFQSANFILNNSTVTGNSAISGGWGTGGIQTYQSATLTLNNSTVTGNSGTDADGIDTFQFAITTAKNTIIANNGASDCSGSITSAGHNLDSDGSCGLAGIGDISNADPLLGPLGDNGGPTLTHALLTGSPAIDAGGSDCPPPATDQRGAPRIAGSCDIGAVECAAAGCPPPVPTPTPTPCSGPCVTPTDLPTPTDTPTPTPTPTNTPFPTSTPCGGPCPTPISGPGFNVDSTADAGDANPGNGVCATTGGACTLRAAIQEANALAGSDIITVPAGVYILDGNLWIDTDLTINGAGAPATILDGAGLSRLIYVDAGATVEISDLTIRSGWAFNAAGGVSNTGTLTLNRSTVRANSVGNASGGIGNSGTMTINDSTIRDNHADNASGGIGNSGVMTINNSTISDNSVGNAAGGINNSGTMTINNSTISGNSAGNVAGGIDNSSNGVLTINNSTVAANEDGGIHNHNTITLKNTLVAGNGRFDCGGTITSLGHNLDSDGTCGLTGTGDITNGNPLLGPLADNGGPTQTHALLNGSPAIDAGSSDCPPPATDQRGVLRPAGACDIGAFELCPESPCPTPVPTQTPTPTLTPIPTPTPTPCGGPCPTPTPTETPTDTATPTNTPTVTNTPIPGKAEMALKVKGGACDDPVRPTTCSVLTGSPFLLSVEVLTAPQDGYILAQTFIDFGEELTYKPAPTAADEFSWPECNASIALRASLGISSWSHACLTGFIPPLPVSVFEGNILDLLINCSTLPSSSVVELLPEGDPVARTNGALFKDPNNNTIVPNVGSLTINCVDDAGLAQGDTDGDGCSDQRENGPDEVLGGMRDWQNPWDFYDVLGGGGGPPDGVIDLPNDVLGVLQHFSPDGGASYDVAFDRGPSTGPDPWNMTAPDGAIDLPNDILGVIMQFSHRCT